MTAQKTFVISIENLFGVAARRWRIIAIVVALVLLLGVIYIYLADREYNVSITVRPVSAIEESYNTNILTGLSGLSLGTDLTTQEKFNRYTSYLTSVNAAEKLVDDSRYVQYFFGKGWRLENGQWHLKTSLRSTVKSLLCKVVLFPCNFDMTATRFADALSSRVALSPGANSDMLTLSMLSRDPQVAAEILLAIHEISDNIVREQELATARAFLASLESGAGRVSINEVRTALYEIMARQLQKVAVVESDIPYAADIVTGPLISLEPVRPAIFATLLASIATGLFLGLLWAVWLETRPPS